jgi:uncharacterized LabA/DUF88 family protein
VSNSTSQTRVGIYVDGTYLSQNGGHGTRYDVLREFAVRDAALAVRLNVYVTYDEDRAREDPSYRRGQESFHAVLRDFGYKVHRKRVKWSADESGNRDAHSSVDVDITVDVLQQCGNLDRVLLVTGGADYVQVVRALQSRGCRVEVMGFDNVSPDLREEADSYLSGYLIPNLLPIPDQPEREAWGTLGSRVRGVCYNHSGKGYGFLRYIRKIGPNLWITDSRHPDSPYATVFFHDSQLPENVVYTQLPSRNLVFDFELVESDKFEGDLQAVDLYLVSGQGRPGRAVDLDERPSGLRPLRESEEEEEELDDREADGNVTAETPAYGRRRFVEP